MIASSCLIGWFIKKSLIDKPIIVIAIKKNKEIFSSLNKIKEYLLESFLKFIKSIFTLLKWQIIFFLIITNMIPDIIRKTPNILARINIEFLKISAVLSLAKKPKNSLRSVMEMREIITRNKPEKIKNNIININNIFEDLLIFLFCNLTIKNFYLFKYDMNMNIIKNHFLKISVYYEFFLNIPYLKMTNNALNPSFQLIFLPSS